MSIDDDVTHMLLLAGGNFDCNNGTAAVAVDDAFVVAAGEIQGFVSRSVPGADLVCRAGIPL